MQDHLFTIVVICCVGGIVFTKVALGWEWEVSFGCSATKGIGASSNHNTTPIIEELSDSTDSTSSEAIIEELSDSTDSTSSEAIIEELSDSFESDYSSEDFLFSQEYLDYLDQFMDEDSSDIDQGFINEIATQNYQACVDILNELSNFSIVEPYYSSELFLFILIGFFSIVFIIVFIKFFIKFFKKLI